MPFNRRAFLTLGAGSVATGLLVAIPSIPESGNSLLFAAISIKDAHVTAVMLSPLQTASATP
jgi:hypothetical protein